MWMRRLFRAFGFGVLAVAFTVVGYLIGKREEALNIGRAVRGAKMDWQPNMASRTSFIIKGVKVTGFADSHLIKGTSPTEYTLEWHGDAGLLEDLVMDVQVATNGNEPGVTVVTHQCGRGDRDGDRFTWRVPDLLAIRKVDPIDPPNWQWIGQGFVTLIFRFPDGRPVAIVGGLYLYIRVI